MRITIFGATGGIGREVVSQALAAGHHVTAVVRDPARLSVPTSGNLTVVTADVTDPAAIAPALDGADAGVSALGPRRGDSKSICADGARAILDSMAKTGVRRLVAVSASGLFREAGEPPPDQRGRALRRSRLAAPLLRRAAASGLDPAATDTRLGAQRLHIRAVPGGRAVPARRARAVDPDHRAGNRPAGWRSVRCRPGSRIPPQARGARTRA